MVGKTGGNGNCFPFRTCFMSPLQGWLLIKAAPMLIELMETRER